MELVIKTENNRLLKCYSDGHLLIPEKCDNCGESVYVVKAFNGEKIKLRIKKGKKMLDGLKEHVCRASRT